MNSVASAFLESPELSTGDMDNYLTNIDNVYGINDTFDYSSMSNANSLSCDPVFLENGLQLSFDGSCYSDFTGPVYSSACYSTSDSGLYPDLTSAFYSGSFSKSEPDLTKFGIEPKYSVDAKFSMENKYCLDKYSLESKYSMENKFPLESKFSQETKYGLEGSEMISHGSTPTLPYLTPKIKPKFEYMNSISGSSASTASTMSSSMSTLGPSALNPISSSMSQNMMDMLSPVRAQHGMKKVTTQDLALFNSLMDGNAMTPIRSTGGAMHPGASVRNAKTLSSVNSASTGAYAGDFTQFYHYEEKQNGSPYLRHPSSTQNPYTYNYDNEFSKSVDSLLSFPSDRNVSTTTGSPMQDIYSSSDRSVNNYQNANYQYQKNPYQANSYQNKEMDALGDSYYAPTSVTTNVVASYTVQTFDPTQSSEDRFKDILKTVLKMPTSPETFLSPINSHVLNSYSITELATRYDDSQRAANPSETHVVYVRNNTDMNLILRNDNLLIQHQNKDRNEKLKLKLTKQVLSSKNVATSADLNESMARARNDEQGMSYLPYVSCNWKGVHETSWWMSDDKGVVRNFKVKFDPMVFGSKTVAFEEANKFAKFVEGLIRPGTLINWYPGFNIPIGTSGRANLRKVLHMDRMKNAELCDPVLEANGLKVAAKSTFGDMIIVELYKAAYVLGLWDVAAYNCLKTCKRRGYSFEWIHDIQSSGKRITLDALKYMRNVKEMVEQDKLSRVNSEKKRRRRKVPEKRRKSNAA